MIASLHGTALSIGLTGAAIETGGVGMSIQATPTTLSGLGVGEGTSVHTGMVVREDSPTLFDFADIDERDSLRTLMNAKGAGAKLTLAMLAIHMPNALRRTIISQDVAILTRVPGLEPKGIQRVTLDVVDKLGPVTGDDLEATQTVVQSVQRVETMNDGGPRPHADVIAVLVQSDWNEASMRQMVPSVTAGATDGGQESDVAAVLRASLRWLGGGHCG